MIESIGPYLNDSSALFEAVHFSFESAKEKGFPRARRPINIDGADKASRCRGPEGVPQLFQRGHGQTILRRRDYACEGHGLDNKSCFFKKLRLRYSNRIL